MPNLPAEKGNRKFSSWNTGGAAPKDKKLDEEQADFLDEVDELLLEQDLLSPSGKSKTQHKKSPEITEISQKKKTDNKLRDSTLDKLLSNEEDFLDK